MDVNCAMDVIAEKVKVPTHITVRSTATTVGSSLINRVTYQLPVTYHPSIPNIVSLFSHYLSCYHLLKPLQLKFCFSLLEKKKSF